MVSPGIGAEELGLSRDSCCSSLVQFGFLEIEFSPFWVSEPHRSDRVRDTGLTGVGLSVETLWFSTGGVPLVLRVLLVQGWALESFVCSQFRGESFA